jgi:hypothetical protein
MMTGVYWPQCRPINVGGVAAWDYGEDSTDIHINQPNEGPSYCVRLLVFDYEDFL